jgi:alkylhydroperoxidase/carboxymuconolactone decarboxylase family protein YurZ
MEDIHEIFTIFKSEFPGLYERIDSTGHALHVEGGPLEDRTRALLKIAMSASSRHQRALETHLAAARGVGVSEHEIMHTLLLVIPTCGFPTFMEAYSTYKGK